MMHAHPAVLSLLAIGSLTWGGPAAAQSLYFPPDDGPWERVDPASVGWDADALSAALDVAGARSSSGVVILHDGRILAERDWDLVDPPRGYTLVLMGLDADGRAIEDVASAQKSITAVLVGIARERGLVDLDDPVSKHLGPGWSAAPPEREVAITLRHLVTMTSGLATDMTYEAEPGTRWLYNTPAYHVVMRVVEAVTGRERNALTAEWITDPLGMPHSSWTARPWADAGIGVGFSTTARELARFGLMIQAGGRWKGETIVGDKAYLDEMLRPSQPLNPSYGYLWWLNGQGFALASGPGAARRDGPLIPAAPRDLVAMQGARDRKLYLVPSFGLVVTRLGDVGAEGGESFNDAFWRALMRARRPQAAGAIEGRWRLVAGEDLNADGSVARYPWGRAPVGSIVVQDGACYLQIMSSDVPAFPPGLVPTVEQMSQALFSTYISYTGPCAIDEAEGRVTLDVRAAWRPGYRTDQTRYFRVEGDVLFFGPTPRVRTDPPWDPTTIPEGTFTRRLRLERVSER